MNNRLRTIAAEHRRTLVAGITLQTLQSYVGMLTIVFFQRIIDTIRNFGTGEIAGAVGVYIVLTAMNHLLIYAQYYPHRMYEVGTFFSVKRLAMGKLATVDYQTYAEMGTGTTLQIVENGANAGSSILNNFWKFVMLTALSLPFQLYLIQMYDFTLFLVVLAGYGVLFTVAQLLMKVSRATMEKVVSRKEELSHRFARGFMEMVNLRIQRRFKQEIEQVDALANDVVRSEGRIRLVNELFFTGFALLVFGVEIAVIVRQAVLIGIGESTIGTLVALVMFVRSVFFPVSGFSFAYVRYKMDKVPWQRMEEFLDVPNDRYLVGSDKRESAVEGEMVMRSVSFRYAEQPILNDVSLRLRPGRITSIVGTSGSGKTTILRLLLGLLSPESGSVLVGEADLSEVDIDGFYETVSFVSQDAPVMAGTLRENIVGKNSVSEDDLRSAIEATHLTEVVRRLENGLETEVGERGIVFSSGERQRIALARVLLSPTQRVFLDEPTSALDSETEVAVLREFFTLVRNRMVVLVAHRLQPVRLSDSIVVIENGTIAESGTYEELMKSRGRFRALWDEQTRR